MIPVWQNLSDAIFHHAAKRPAAPALVENDRPLSYGDFAALVGKASVHLRDIGVGPGDRVGIVLANSADHLILFYAAMRAGAVPIEISPQTSEAEREALAEKFGIGLLFEEPDARAAASRRTIWVDAGWRASIESRTGDWRHDDPKRDPFIVGLTSGSTGLPKGAIILHRHIQLRYRDALAARAQSPGSAPDQPENSLLLASLSFSAFRNHAICAVLLGQPLILVPEFQWPSNLIRAIRSWDQAVLMVTPGMCRAFLAFAHGPGQLFPRVRAMFSAGLPLFPHEKRAVMERVTSNFFEAYGSTASGRISLLRPTDMATRADSVGRVEPGVEVEIVDARGNPRPVGAVGHLRCRSPTVSPGYFVESDTWQGGEGFRDGWFYPGDLASIDDAGYIYLRGRGSDLIVSGGAEILPAEIEAVLAAHALVAESAVVGRAASGLGEEVVALVVTRGEPEHRAIVEHLDRHLPADRRPHHIIYTKALPRTPNGKIDRVAAKRLAIQYAHAPSNI